MAKIFYPDFFNDVFGPIMQPGSSGSFAGTSRVGHAAHYLLAAPLTDVKIRFNKSDRKHLENLGNMMDDRGYLGGLLGYNPDDYQLFFAHENARKQNLSYSFSSLDYDTPYPGSVQFDLIDQQANRAQLIGQSVGGGMILIYEINGYPVRWSADTYLTLIEAVTLDQLPSSAELESVESLVDYHWLEKTGSHERGLLLESSAPLTHLADHLHFIPQRIVTIPALLPVVTTLERQPQLFSTIPEWIAYANDNHISFLEAAIHYEQAFSAWSKEAILEYFEVIAGVLNHQIHALEEIGYDQVEDTEMLPVYGKYWNTYKQSGKVLQDSLASRIMDYAFSTNAKIPGVKIVPGPMGTGGGYLFSALEGVREFRGYSHEKLIEGLIIAAMLGAIAFTHAKASGASGCVGESGICCAMASGAITWMAGGSGEAVEHAASMALQANIGIPCDPIPGGLEFPCLTRTVRAAITAPLYADMALAGIDPLIPYHEVLFAIEKNRQVNSEALCGYECGVNCTLTAAKCRQFLQGSVMKDRLTYVAPKIS